MVRLVVVEQYERGNQRSKRAADSIVPQNAKSQAKPATHWHCSFGGDAVPARGLPQFKLRSFTTQLCVAVTLKETSFWCCKMDRQNQMKPDLVLSYAADNSSHKCSLDG